MPFGRLTNKHDGDGQAATLIRIGGDEARQRGDGAALQRRVRKPGALRATDEQPFKRATARARGFWTTGEAKLKDSAASDVDGGSPAAEPTASAPC